MLLIVSFVLVTLMFVDVHSSFSFFFLLLMFLISPFDVHVVFLPPFFFSFQRVHDELADLMDMTEEINQAMSMNFDTEEMDESELDDELASLGDELICTDADSTPSYLDAISTTDAPQMEAVSAGGGGDAYAPAAPAQHADPYAFPAIPAGASNS